MGITVRKKGSKAVILKFCWILDSTNELIEGNCLNQKRHTLYFSNKLMSILCPPRKSSSYRMSQSFYPICSTRAYMFYPICSTRYE